MLKEKEKTDLLDLFVETFLKVVERREKIRKEEFKEQIKKHYAKIFNDDDYQTTIAYSLWFMEQHLEDGGNLYFFNKSVWNKRNFSGLIIDKVDVERYSPVGILAIEKEVLYELGFDDSKILIIDKNTPKEVLMEAFVYNNLYLFPQKIVTLASMFDNKTSEKFPLFWKYLENSSVECIPDFNKKIRKIKDSVKMHSNIGSNYDASILGNSHEIRGFEVENAHLKDINIYDVIYLLKDIFVENKIPISELKILKTSNCNDIGGFPLLDTPFKIFAYLCKDFEKNLNNDEIDNADIALTDIFISRYNTSLFDGKNNNNDMKKNFNVILDFLEKKSSNENNLIKKTNLYQVLDPIEERLAYFDLFYSVDINTIVDSIPALKNNDKSDILEYAEYFNVKNIDDKYYCCGSKLFLDDLQYSTFSKRLCKEIMKDFESFKNAEFNISFSEKNYILETNIEVEKEVFEKVLKGLFIELIEKRKVLKQNISKELYEQLQGDYKEIFKSGLLIKRIREDKIHSQLMENDRGKISRKKI